MRRRSLANVPVPRPVPRLGPRPLFAGDADPLDHNHHIVAEREQPVTIRQAPIYNNPQTVHTSAVNRTAMAGARRILQEPGIPLQEAIRCLMPWWKIWRSDLKKHVINLCARPERIGGMTFSEVFCSAMGIVAREPDRVRRKLMMTRLYTELTEGQGYCLQGNIARLVNAFTGILEGVQVGISEQEQQQAAMARIANLEGRTTEQKQEAARAVLRELAIPEGQWDAWLDAM
jgi:hypothetical protein